MAATTGFSASPSSSNVELSYVLESAWATLPASPTFGKVRFMSETLSGSKKRDRPSEAGQFEVSAAVTTEEMAGGNIAFALTFNDLTDVFASALNAEPYSGQTVTGSGALPDTTITNPTNVLSTTDTGLFIDITVGMWVKMVGWANAANNGYFRVVAKASNSSITLSPPSGGAFVTETKDANTVFVRIGTTINSNVFKSLYFQKRLADSQYLRYPGMSVTGFTLSGGVGQFLTGSFDMVGSHEEKATSGAESAMNPAATTRVFEPTGNFLGVYWDNALVDATVESFAITVSREGQATQHGMGTPEAVGVTVGRFTASARLKLYFKNYVYYDLFRAETAGSLSIMARDSSYNTYVFTLVAANMMNAKINAGGPNQPVFAEFEVEGNPQPSGGTLQIDALRFIATETF